MATQAARGKKALESSNYEEAIEAFTAALKEFPTSPDYLIQRSSANHRAKKYEDALRDAENGVIQAQKRAKRELIIEAQLRRGIAFYMLGRYGDAEFLFNLVKTRDPEHKQATMWTNKTALALKAANDEQKQLTISETPQPSKATTHEKSGATATPSDQATGDKTPPTTALPQQTPVDKIRHEWYQNTENIYFTLFVKGVSKDHITTEIKERRLAIAFPLNNGATYDLTLDPLYAPVKPEKCITRVLPSKVEITLVKATAGNKWPSMESKEPIATTTSTVTASTDSSAPSDIATDRDEAIKNAILQDAKISAPAYPTSSKSGPKDWDKITKDLQAADRKDGESETQGGDDDYDDDEGGDPTNSFFKRLYKDASPEAKRAMMKSFTESNGTALSTNWDEVGKGKVETVPPEGMDAKEW